MKNSSCAWKNLILLLQSLIKLGTIIINFKAQNLADGTYELVPESESEQREAQVNLTEITKDLNQSSEEPKASSAQEGKPRSMSYLF